jgi:hypothetical protein
MEKPVSCHLYPVRIKDFTEFAAVNYDKWDICDPACSLGQELEVPVYKFVRSWLAVGEAAHENAQRHRQLSCHGRSELVKHPPS